MVQHTDDEQTRDDRADDAPESAAGLSADANPETPVEHLTREVEELRSKWMRAQADYQNLRRRSAGDLESGIRRRLLPLLEELLLVVDYLDLALASPAEGAQAKSLATGVEMTRAKLLSALEQESVVTIPTDGKFDPELHEAAQTRAQVGVEPGTILEVVRKGYTWRETILRPAHVVVAAEAEEREEEPPQEGARDLPTN